MKWNQMGRDLVPRVGLGQNSALASLGFGSFWNMEVHDIWPSVDIFDRGGDLVVKIELGGTRQDCLEIELEDGLLNISGEIRCLEAHQDSSCYFYRAVAIPERVSEADVSARMERENLLITVRGAALTTPGRRMIPIDGFPCPKTT